MSTVEGSNSEIGQGSTATLDPPYIADEQNQAAPQQKMTATDVLVLLGGVAFPAIATITTALSCSRMGAEMLMRHPVETLAQYALVVCIPAGNYVIWNRIRHQNFANLMRIGLLSGLSTGTSALVLAICIVASVVGTQSENGAYVGHTSFPSFFGAVAAASFTSSVYLMRQLCLSWATRGARNRQLVFSLAGIFLSLLVVGASEARQTVVKLSERATVTEDSVQREAAMNTLHMPLLDAGHELRQDILDLRSGGLSGMLLGIDPGTTKQLYFNLTGTPYQSIAELTANDGGGDSTLSSTYENYLADQTIGEVVPGLSLKRSQIRGGVNSSTLTANLEWTFVIKNKSQTNAEARAEIALPPGAVVSKLTLWQEGRPTDALISASYAGDNAHSKVDNPASIRYMGKGRVLLECRPSEHGNESKVSVTMIAPLKLDTEGEASLALPRLMASNFNASINHDLHLLSDSNLKFGAANLHSITNSGKTTLYVGTIKSKEAKNAGLSLIVSRKEDTGRIATRNTYAKNYTVQSVEKVPNNVPRNLVVVIDGSKSVKGCKSEVTTLLSKVQKLVPTTVLIADADSTEAPDTLSVKEAIEQLNATTFDGGHDNLPAVVKAGELAGQQSGSAVLWIHGPQPALNEEIYITSQAASRPSFYDLAVDDGWTNTSAFLKNHQDIGPIIPVARTGELKDDLNHFISQWQPGGHHYSVQIATQILKPDCLEIAGPDAIDLSVLGAAHNCKHLIAQNEKKAATKLAIAAHIVTPLTIGAVLPIGEYQIARANETADTTRVALGGTASNDSLSGFNSPAQETNANAPALQAATNGTVGPQGADATYITGIDTAGTIRVNNLANIEALLNIVANLIEMAGISFGGFIIVDGCRKGFNVNKLVYGIAAILLGLATPGVINWLVASARDANLYS